MQSNYDKLGENVLGPGGPPSCLCLLNCSELGVSDCSSPHQRRGEGSPTSTDLGRLLHPPPILTKPGFSPTSQSVLIFRPFLGKVGRREVYSSFFLSLHNTSLQQLPRKQRKGKLRLGVQQQKSRLGRGALLRRAFPSTRLKASAEEERGGFYGLLVPLPKSTPGGVWESPPEKPGRGRGAPFPSARRGSPSPWAARPGPPPLIATSPQVWPPPPPPAGTWGTRGRILALTPPSARPSPPPPSPCPPSSPENGNLATGEEAAASAGRPGAVPGSRACCPGPGPGGSPAQGFGFASPQQVARDALCQPGNRSPRGGRGALAGPGAWARPGPPASRRAEVRGLPGATHAPLPLRAALPPAPRAPPHPPAGPRPAPGHWAPTARPGSAPRLSERQVCYPAVWELDCPPRLQITRLQENGFILGLEIGDGGAGLGSGM